MQISEDIVNIIISYLFDECHNCFEYFHHTELIQYCLIYVEDDCIVTFDLVCIHCLNRYYSKSKILHN